jgi:hypothetical protein
LLEKKYLEPDERRHTCLAVGWINPSLTFFAVLVTVEVNHPNPFVSAATGSFCKSSSPGSAFSSF